MRDDVHAAPADVELADHGGVRALEDLDDLAIGASARLDARDADDDAVAMHRLLRGVRRDEDVALDGRYGALGDEEAVPVPMQVEPADRKLAAARGDHVLAAAEFDQVAARGQAGEGRVEIVASLAFSSEFANELLEVRPGVGQFGDVVQKGPVCHSSNFIATLGR